MNPDSAEPRPHLRLLLHTEHLVVVDKPGGLLVHRSSMGHEGPYIDRLLADQLGCRVHPVHRLDRPTSGCLLFALSPAWATALQAAMASPEADKRYLAMVRGRWKRDEPVTVVDRAIKDDNGRIRDALSEVRCLATSAEPRTSLVEVRARTGRYHQVRRHLRGLDHPVLGDSTHGDTRTNRLWREQWDLPRLLLHCWRLEIPLADGTWLRVQAPIPEDFLGVLRVMPWFQEVAAGLGVVTQAAQ